MIKMFFELLHDICVLCERVRARMCVFIYYTSLSLSPVVSIHVRLIRGGIPPENIKMSRVTWSGKFRNVDLLIYQ